MKGLQTEEGGIQYSHGESLNDIYDVLRDVTLDEMNKEFQDSPYSVMGLMMDEATDSSNQSVLLIYRRFVNEFGNCVTQFIGARSLEVTNADGIMAAVLKLMEDRALDMKEVVGLATDGASVMTGVKTGVATRLKEINPAMITIHCMAHRLQLLSEKAANCVPYVVKYIAVLNEFAKALKFSPKLCRALENAKNANGESACKVKQVFFTRWLSFQDSVQALSSCLSSVISCLQVVAMERNTEGRAKLHGVLNQMATFKFVGLTHFLADVIGILGILSKCMQKENVQHSELASNIQATIAAITVLKSSPGPYYGQFLSKVPKSPDGSDYCQFENHDIKDTEAERKKLAHAMENYFEEIITHLECNFAEKDQMSIFDVLNPCSMQEVEDKDEITKFENLLKRYQDYVSTKDSQEEWLIVKEIMKEDKYKEMDMQQFFKKVLHKRRSTFPNIARLAAIGISIPLTSVDCERGVSRFNAIKTDSRSSMKNETAENLLFLSLHAQPLEKFNFEEAFQKWIHAKDRRGFAAITKNLKK